MFFSFSVNIFCVVFFSDLDKEIRNLCNKGIRLFCYITPHLNKNGSIYHSNKDKGYFVKSKDGSDYVMDFGQFDTITVDLTNPEAYTWFKGRCKFTFTYITKRTLAHPPNGYLLPCGESWIRHYV